MPLYYINPLVTYLALKYISLLLVSSFSLKTYLLLSN